MLWLLGATLAVTAADTLWGMTRRRMLADLSGFEVAALLALLLYADADPLFLLPVAAPLAPRVDHRAGRHHQAAGRMIAEGRGEQLGAAALRADAGQQQDGVRHQLAGPGDGLGLRGADHRAHAGEAARADVRGAPRRGQLGHPLPHRSAIGQRLLLDVGAAGVRGAGEHEQAGAVAAGGQEGREGVAAHVRSHGQGVGHRPLAVPGVQPGLGVGGAGRADIAALGVDDHQQTGLACQLADPLERRDAVAAERLEERDLRLHRDGLAGHRVDHAGAEPLVGPGPARAARPEAGDQLGRQLLDPGIEADAQRAAGLLDRLGDPVSERHRRKPTECLARPTSPASEPSSVSGTARTRTPGRANAAATIRAASACSGSNTPGRPVIPASSATSSGAISSRPSPLRGTRRRATTRPRATANAWTKRSSTSGASSTPLRPRARRSLLIIRRTLSTASSWSR